MKKVFLLLIAGLLATLSHAEVYYLLPATGANAPVGDVYDVLPWEGDGTEENREVSPERRAFEYCRDGINGGTAKYVTIKDVAEGKLLVDGKPAMTTLWVNIDRWNLSLGNFDAMFNDAVTAGLSAYVKAGGNLFLSKQASRLASKIGRAQWWPNDYNSNGYFDAGDEWQMCVHFCTDGNIDNPFHACMKYMQNGQSQDELEFVTRFPMVSGEGSYRRSDNNCAWGDFNLYAPGKGGCDNERRAGIENGMNCKVLGGWGHTRGLDYAGFIEFYPQGDYKGTVMAMGLAAYQWGAQNKSEYNVKNLTKGILEYLEGSAYWAADATPRDGVVGESFNCFPQSAFQGYHIDLISTDPTVASFRAEGDPNPLTLNAQGTTIIRATFTGDGKHSCKTQIVLEKEITVSPFVPVVTWTLTPGDAAVSEYKDPAQATSNAVGAVVKYRSLNTDVIEIDENTGALTYKAPAPDGVMVEAYIVFDGVEYKAEHLTKVFAPLADWNLEKLPAATATVGDEMEIAAAVRFGAATLGFECVNCTYADGKLTFEHAGVATVQPYAEAYGVRYYNYENKGDKKTITVAPKLVWTVEPQSAFVGEQGKKAVASSSDGTVIYTSSNTDMVAVDEAGNLTFLGYDEGGKVTITASVTIGEGADAKTYEISGELDANLPNVMWTSEPAANAYLHGEMAIAAQLQWWTDHELFFETENCSYADGKLTMTTIGEAKVRPYVLLTAANKAYYGEEKVITVADDAVVYTRSTTAGKYGTICVERPSVAAEGATFFLPVAIVKEGDVVKTITLEEVTEPLVAGQGYFFLANAAQLQVTMSLNDEALTQSDLRNAEKVQPTHGMLGTFDQIAAPITTGNELFLSNNQLWYSSTSGNYIGEHRAWVKLNELQVWIDKNGTPESVPGRRRVSMAVEQTDTATDVLRLATYPEAAKVVLNGTVYILREGKFFLIDGRQAK